MAAALTALLKTLSLSDDPDHESILKACNEALREDKGNADAQHVRAIALLKLDRYDDALKQLEDGGADLKERAHLEYAYALYKEGRLADARKKAETEGSRGGKHLEAQSSYRLQDFESAGRLLKELQNGSIPEREENDLRINTTATDAQLEWQRKEGLVSRRKPSREDLEVFETAFNAACASIARGELPQAEMLLGRAESLCLDLDLSEEDKEAELLPVKVQQLFVSVLLNKSDQADTLAKELGTDTFPRSSTAQISQINQIVANHSSFNPFLSSRILKARPHLARSDQFFDYQSGLFSQNEVALEFLSGKFSGIASTTSKKLQSEASPTTSREYNAASSANAAAHAQLEVGKAGIKSMQPLLQRRPHDIGLIATIVQLYVSVKNHGSAIKLLEDLFKHLEQSGSSQDMDVRFAPGIVATIVSLYSIEGRKGGIKNELAKAASFWQKKSILQPGLMKAAGHALIRSGTPSDISEAKKLFDNLSKESAFDKFVATGRVASQATADTATLDAEATSLPTIDQLIKGIDVDALDAEGVPQPVSTATMLSRKRAADAAKPAKKRFRKSRLPKNHDPNAKVDPERWLPMRDRSYYRPKNKKKKGKNTTQGGTQGAIATDDVPSAQPGPVTGGGGSGGGKKKKKNKK